MRKIQGQENSRYVQEKICFPWNNAEAAKETEKDQSRRREGNRRTRGSSSQERQVQGTEPMVNRQENR